MEYRDFTEEELKWIKSFERVMKKAPSSLLMFVGTGIYIHPLKENGERYIGSFGEIDGQAPSVLVQTPMDADGGDY
jgi:hypothetical protein